MKTPSLTSLIKEKEFDWVNSNITDTLFPEPKEIRNDFKLFHFDKYFSSEDAIKELEKYGWRAANAWELLSWKDWNGKDWVVALGSVGEVHGDHLVPSLDGGSSKRYLDLDWWGDDWSSFCRFLAVATCKDKATVIQSTHEKCKHTINFCPACGEKI